MTVRLARALWIAWAVVVWNVVFDFVIVAAGRDVVHASGLAAGRVVNIDEFMRPAVTHGLWLATLAAAVIAAVGLSSIHLARSR